MIGHSLLFIIFEKFVTLNFSSTDKFEIIVSADSFLFFKTILEYIESIKADFDIMGDFHDTAEVCWLSKLIEINALSLKVVHWSLMSGLLLGRCPIRLRLSTLWSRFQISSFIWWRFHGSIHILYNNLLYTQIIVS